WPSAFLARPRRRIPSPHLEECDEAHPRPGTSLPMRSAVAFRELGDDPARLLAGGDALDVVEAVPEARRPVLPRRPRRARREPDVRQGEERMVGLWWLFHEDVEARPRDLLLGQGW